MQKGIVLFTAALLAATVNAKTPTTQVPFTYVIDYTGLQSSDPKFREKISQAPPELYHVGGEMRYLGRFGLGCTVVDYRSIPYDLYKQRTKDYIDFLHGNGVRWVTPYLCNQTISGNVEQRYGAWEVYDRWGDFTFLDIGPKPADPINWMQREPSGNLHYNYKRKCFLERHDDDLQIRYAPCPNNSEWRRLMNAEARTSARLGFDGIFIDNNIIHCYCSSCEARFQTYLKQKYTPTELATAFGTSNYEEITLYKEGDLRYWARTFQEFIPWLEQKYLPPERRVFFDTTGPISEVNVDAAGGGMLFGLCQDFVREVILSDDIDPNFENLRLANPALQTATGRLRWAETMMFWGWSIGHQLAEMRDAGREVKPNFFLMPNWGVFQRIQAAVGRAEDGKDLRRYSYGAKWQMYEEDSATGIIAPGLVLDYDLQLRYAFACGVRAMLLPYTLNDADVEKVQQAEAAASGGSVFVTTFRNPEIRAVYRKFFNDHPELYQGFTSAADVALTFFFDQCHFLNIEHFRHVHALNRYLADQQIPFDIVTEDDFYPQRLGDYKVLIVPNIVFISDDQMDAISKYLDHGGVVIFIGENCSHDVYCKKRTHSLKQIIDSERIYRFESLESALPYRGLYLADGLQAVRSISTAETIKKLDNSRYVILAELDQTLRFKRYQKSGPITKIIANAQNKYPHIMAPEKASGVRQTVWHKLQGSDEIITIHLVNKNVPLAATEGRRTLKVINDLDVVLPVQASKKIKQVQVWAPGEIKYRLEPKIKDTGLIIRLPRLDAYAIIEIIVKS